MFHEDQPVSGRGPAHLDDPLPIGCGATLTKAERRDGGAASGSEGFIQDGGGGDS